MDYLSLCLICKDENDYLAEWLDYHILVGVERFYIFDNESRVSLRESLKDYIEKGWVVVVDAPGKGVQLFAYDTCLRMFGKNSRWIGFTDTDEFLVVHTGQDLKEFLKDYEAYGGLAVSSLFFGSNGHKTRPAAGQLASYTLRTDETFFENDLVKCIVQPDKVLAPNSPHDFIFQEKYYCVNEAKIHVDFQRFPNSIQKIQLNHYFCRSQAEIDAKLSRGRGDTGDPWKKRRFDEVNVGSIVPDKAALYGIAKVVAALQSELGADADLLDTNSTLKTISICAQARIPGGRLVGEQVALLLSDEMTSLMQVFNKISAAESSKDFVEVRKHILDLIQRYPHRVVNYTGLAIASLELKDPATAWQALTLAWELAPNSFLVLGGMTDYFLRVQNYAMAEKTCALRLEIAPHHLISISYMTEALIGQGRFEEAIKIGVPLVKLADMVGELPDGKISYLVSSMAGYLEKKGDYRTLVSLWETALSSQPDQEENKLGLARAKKLANYRSSRRSH
jgi:tetratricopeptide (TPR) repeat protein